MQFKYIDGGIYVYRAIDDRFFLIREGNSKKDYRNMKITPQAYGQLKSINRALRSRYHGFKPSLTFITCALIHLASQDDEVYERIYYFYSRRFTHLGEMK